MASQLTIDKERTDNIEVLFKALFYLEYIPGHEEETTKIRASLEKEFEQFPVEFGKDHKAYRYSEPYKYHESGRVDTKSGDLFIMLSPWDVAERPQPKTKKTNKKPAIRYDLLEGVNPIWFMQLVAHQKRKAKRKRYSIVDGEKVKHLSTAYRTHQIMKTLSIEEQQLMNSTHQEHISNYMVAVLRDFNISMPGKIEVSNQHPFFFLNEQELGWLADAFASDMRNKPRYLTEQNTPMILQALTQIVNSQPKERHYLDTHPLEIKILEKLDQQRKEYNGYRYNNDNFLYKQLQQLEKQQEKDLFELCISIWNTLHESYTDLSEKELAVLDRADVADLNYVQELRHMKEGTQHEDTPEDQTIQSQ